MRRRRRSGMWSGLLKKSGSGMYILTILLLALALNASAAMRILYPFPYREQVMYTAAQNQVDPHLVMAVIYNESHFVESAASKAGALGLMQIMPETGQWIAGQLGYREGFSEEMLLRPDVNLQMGIWYMSYLNRIFGGNLSQVIAAYNAGEGTVRQWLNQGIWSGDMADIKQIPYRETRQYVDRVINNYELYRNLYKKGVTE